MFTFSTYQILISSTQPIFWDGLKSFTEKGEYLPSVSSQWTPINVFYKTTTKVIIYIQQF